MIDVLRNLQRRATAFEQEAHTILARHETSPSRVISIERTRDALRGLSLQQDALFEQALMCTQHGIYRAAHVVGWAAFMGFLEEKLASDGLARVKAERPKWGAHASMDELREAVPEQQLVEVAQAVKLLRKSEAKILLGLLAKRNECAHPTGYQCGLNEALGYIDELLKRVKEIQPRSL